MSDTLGLNNIGKGKSGLVNIPDNNLAKLMYYLNCVTIVIKFEPSKDIIDYKNYSAINEKDKKLIYQLATIFEPKVFQNEGIFIVNPDLVSNKNENEFLEINDERTGAHIYEDIIAGGKSRKVLKIMACKSSWLDNYFYNPLKAIRNEINGVKDSVSVYVSKKLENNSQSNRVIVNQKTPMPPPENEANNSKPRSRGDYYHTKGECYLYIFFCVSCPICFLIYYLCCLRKDEEESMF